MNDQQPAGDTVEAEIMHPVTINLDALEREGDQPEPFTFQHDGRRYTLTDPRDVDWQDIVAALSNPFLFFKATMTAEDQLVFLSTKLPARKLNALIDRYVEHFGLPQVGESTALSR